MARHRSQYMLQFAAGVRDVAQCGPEAVTGGAQLVGPWFSSLTAAQYLDQPTRGAFRKWAKRNHVIAVNIGGLMRYAKADIDRVRLRRSA